MKIRKAISFCIIVLMTSLTDASAFQELDEPFQLTASDGFVLDGKIRLPAGESSESISRIIILLHGSGPQSMDEDLTSLTKGGKKNLVFQEISDALSEVGFGVIRYNKRSYQANLSRKADAAFLESDLFKTFAADPLKYFVDDAADAVRFAEERFPAADIYLLGHSQGTFIALEVANVLPQVKGVALIGYYVSSTETVLFEQTVYRPLHLFEQLDLNGDDMLDADEIGGDDPIATSLRSQLSILDLDGDGMISKIEFQAGNLSNLVTRDLLSVLRKSEASYPRTADILASASFKVAFFQGLLDNQTPAYNTKAIELVARHVWKKDNFFFRYFPGLGHALDRRSGYDDLEFDTIDPEAKAQLAEGLAALF